MDALLLLFTALPLLLSVSADVKTYKHELPSGETVVCDRCPPGTYRHTHCTKTRPTECRPCSSGFYTPFWNYIPECLPCDLCVLNQEETQSCTPSQNRACQCREGYYWLSRSCRKYTVCPAGHGIKTKGTPYRDTECEECTSGHYAGSGRVDHSPDRAVVTQCTPHTACKNDERLVIHGTNWHDNVCVTCNIITTQGWSTFIKPLLWKLFNQQKQRRLKLLYCLLSLEGNINSDKTLKDWVIKASEQQLTDLPAKMLKANLPGLTDHVEQKIKKFQEEAKYCSNTIM